jgi:hypothetical protein
LKPKFKERRVLMIGALAVVVVMGIFVGIVVIFGNSNAIAH